MQVNFSQPVKKIVILGTGGTIAGRAANPGDNVGYVAGQVGIEELLESVPGLAVANDIVCEQVAQIDSKDMSFTVWASLAMRVSHFLARDDVQGVVVTHGTDTLEETAFFLQALLNPAKPVVLTCAMRPATALFPDGPQNVLDAVSVARHVGARGVVAVCAGFIHGAIDVQKTSTIRLDAFSSAEAGPIGYVEEGLPKILRNWPETSHPWAEADVKTLAEMASDGAWPKVEIVMNYAGATGVSVQALQASGVKGLVVAGTGNGTLHTDLEAALLAAHTAGVRVMRSTRCAMGHVTVTRDDPFEDAKGLSPVKARVALILHLLRAKIGKQAS